MTRAAACGGRAAACNATWAGDTACTSRYRLVIPEGTRFNVELENAGPEPEDTAARRAHDVPVAGRAARRKRADRQARSEPRFVLAQAARSDLRRTRDHACRPARG